VILCSTAPRPCFDFTPVRFCSVSSVFCNFPLFPVFSRFSSVFLYFVAWFLCFPLLSLFLCLVPLFFVYFLYLFLLTLSTTYQSYLRTVLRSSCLLSLTGRPILHRISILTTLVRRIGNIENTHSKWAATNRMGQVARSSGRENSRIRK